MLARAFLVSLIALVVAALAGCGSDDSTSGDSSSTVELDSLETTTPAGSGELASASWNLLREPITVDPIKSQTEAENPVVTNMCDTLLRMTPDFQVEPGIAESFEQASPTQWVYKIRSGVTFWNGKPLTADDVVYSLNRSFTDPTSYWPLYFDRVSSVTKTGSDEVTIELSKPYSMLNSELSTLGGAIVEQDATEAAGSKAGTPSEGMMCSGPFEFTSWDPGSKITLTRNENWWDQENLPTVAELTYDFISDDSTATSALTSGSIDGMYEAPVAGVQQLESSANGALHLGPSTRMLSLVPTEKPGGLLQDVNIRRALYLAVDRAAIAETIFGGAAVGAKSVAAPTWGYSQDIFQSYYDSIPDPAVDLEGAKSLVETAGSPSQPILIATDHTPSSVDVANTIQSAAEQIGLDVQVKVLTGSEAEALFFDKKLRSQYDGFLQNPFTFVADPLELGIYLLPGSYYNYGLYDNPQFNADIEKALATYDDDERADILVDAMKIIDEEVPWIPIVYQPERLYMSNQVSGAPPSWSYMSAAWATNLGTAGG